MCFSCRLHANTCFISRGRYIRARCRKAWNSATTCFICGGRGINAGYRDAWNRIVLRRLAKNHAHSLKIRAKVKTKGYETFLGQRRSNWVRSKARTQALWSLHLAGDFQEQFETVAAPTSTPHKMRTMLIANLAVGLLVLCMLLCMLTAALV